MQDKIFYTSCFGFIFGVLSGAFIFINFYATIWVGMIAFAFIIFFAVISKNKLAILIAVFIFVFCFGITRFNFAQKRAPDIFEAKVDQKVSFSGIIIDEPDKRENNQKLIITIKKGEEKANILITTILNEDYKYGDGIRFEGILKKPENFLTDQGKEFDYVNYLRKDGILYVMSYPTIEILSNGNGNFIKSILFMVKEKFLYKMNLVIREPESLLMGGLILGEKSSFNQSLRQNFVDTGTIHIVALSGYNVTIVAEWIMKIFSSFPRHIGIGAGIFSILLFVLMTGGSSTAVRAGIMAIIALFGRWTGRKYDASRALVLAGVLMILINPFVLVFDVSFQLSFIATVAVIFYAPRIEKYFLWVTPRFGLRDIISVTCAAYIFVLPFILYKMGNLSLVALPANIFILPFIPLTMILGFLTGIAGIVSYIFSVPLGFLSYLFLHYELEMIDIFSRIPFAALSVPDFPLFITLLAYAYFVFMLFGKSIKNFFTESF